MTNDSRYSPPTAVVADPAPQHAPRQVRLAVNLLWSSLALAVPAIYLSTARSPEDGHLVIVVVVYGLLFAFSALLNVMVHRGKNWARIVTFLLTLFGAFFLFVPVEEPIPPSVVEWAINVVCFFLEISAIYLLFTKPGATWFKRQE